MRPLCITLLCALCGTASGQRSALFEDAFGYAGFEGPDGRCLFQAIDISGAGKILTLAQSGVEPASDEGVAAEILVVWFTFYDNTFTDVAVSSNGYVAFGQDDGRDFSNDCPIPAVPGNDQTSPARVMALHDDLDGENSSILMDYFAVCPRQSGTRADGACSVFQWQDWGYAYREGTVTFQAILYHESGTIVVQYLQAPVEPALSATLGIQNGTSDSAVQMACDATVDLTRSRAVCFYRPDYPSLIDLDALFLDSFQ